MPLSFTAHFRHEAGGSEAWRHVSGGPAMRGLQRCEARACARTASPSPPATQPLGSLQAPRTVRLLSPCCRLDTRKWGLAQSLLPGPAESPRCSGCPRTVVLPVAQPVPGAQRSPCGHWGQALARSGGRALSGGCCPRKRGLCRPLEPGGTTGRGSRKAGRFSLLGTVSFFPFLFF